MRHFDEIWDMFVVENGVASLMEVHFGVYLGIKCEDKWE